MIEYRHNAALIQSNFLIIFFEHLSDLKKGCEQPSVFINYIFKNKKVTKQKFKIFKKTFINLKRKTKKFTQNQTFITF